MAKEYINSKNNGVDIEILFDEYTKNVTEFHNWFVGQVWEQYPSLLYEYYHSINLCKGAALRPQWMMIIDQILIPKNLNPYMHLDRFLTEEQIQATMSFPFRSKEQVDRIIGYVDIYGACDDVLRQRIYELFKVDNSAE